MAVKIEVKGPIVSNDTAWLYHYFGWDACGPNDISSKLEEAAGDEVILEINSPGGLCSSGYEMYTQLMAYEGKVTAHVIVAASAASLLVCAADNALASDTCIFMIHNVQSGVSGDYRDMQMAADMLKEFNTGIINAYIRKTGKSREELQALMDNETYMSAQTAIENGFIDGYIFDSPEGQKGEDTAIVQDSMMFNVMNTAFPVITDGKAKEIMAVLKTAIPNTDMVVPNLEDNSTTAVSEIDSIKNNQKEGEKKNMTLEEIYVKYPELKDEVDVLVNNAQTQGADMERGRLCALDKIAGSVTSEALEDAKYGENRIDAKELAYQAMLKDRQKVKNYLADAMEDSENSGVEDVGTGLPEEDTTDESDDMASYVNAKRKGRVR